MTVVEEVRRTIERLRREVCDLHAELTPAADVCQRPLVSSTIA